VLKPSAELPDERLDRCLDEEHEDRGDDRHEDLVAVLGPEAGFRTTVRRLRERGQGERDGGEKPRAPPMSSGPKFPKSSDDSFGEKGRVHRHLEGRAAAAGAGAASQDACILARTDPRDQRSVSERPAIFSRWR
jgi:hypothetical protein